MVKISFEKLNSLFEKGTTNIIVSHQEKLLKNADEIIVLKQGELECCGKSKDILKSLDKKQCGRIAEGGNNAR